MSLQEYIDQLKDEDPCYFEIIKFIYENHKDLLDKIIYRYVRDMNDYCEFYYYCCICDNTNIKRIAERDFIDSDTLTVLIEERNIDGLNIVLSKIDIDYEEEDDEEFFSFTPLMLMCLFEPDNHEMIRYLFEKWGPNPNVKCDSENLKYAGMSPLTLLFYDGVINKKSVQVLLEYGAKPDDLLRLLIAFGECPDRKDINETIEMLTFFKYQ